jgi:DNA-binding CsgD family transcriptional regulator
MWQLIHKGTPKSSTIAKIENAGTFRVLTDNETRPKGWEQEEEYESHVALERRDAIWAAVPLGEDLESWMGFYRIGPDAEFFGVTEKELVSRALRPTSWLHQQLLLSHGLHLADKPLTPSERRLLNVLLTDKTEREIAEETGLSPTTVHTYITRICRKFGVRGRAGLMALWLGQPGTP